MKYELNLQSSTYVIHQRITLRWVCLWTMKIVIMKWQKALVIPNIFVKWFWNRIKWVYTYVFLMWIDCNVRCFSLIQKDVQMFFEVVDFVLSFLTPPKFEGFIFQIRTLKYYQTLKNCDFLVCYLILIHYNFIRNVL